MFLAPASGVTTLGNAYQAIGQTIVLQGIEDDKVDVKG